MNSTLVDTNEPCLACVRYCSLIVGSYQYPVHHILLTVYLHICKILAQNRVILNCNYVTRVKFDLAIAYIISQICFCGLAHVAAPNLYLAVPVLYLTVPILSMTVPNLYLTVPILYMTVPNLSLFCTYTVHDCTRFCWLQLTGSLSMVMLLMHGL